VPERLCRFAVDRHHRHLARRHARPAQRKQRSQAEVFLQRGRQGREREQDACERNQQAEAESLAQERHVGFRRGLVGRFMNTATSMRSMDFAARLGAAPTHGGERRDLMWPHS
jgi:hypothetical protein